VLPLKSLTFEPDVHTIMALPLIFAFTHFLLSECKDLVTLKLQLQVGRKGYWMLWLPPPPPPRPFTNILS